MPVKGRPWKECRHCGTPIRITDNGTRWEDAKGEKRCGDEPYGHRPSNKLSTRIKEGSLGMGPGRGGYANNPTGRNQFNKVRGEGTEEDHGKP
jgi:hypothetical protein